MDVKELLVRDRSKQLKSVLDIVGKTEKELNEYVAIIREWIKSQPHLPEVPTDTFITNVVLLHKFSIEKSKQSVDMYYTIKSLMPEVYANANPKLPHMLKVADIFYFLPMPKLTADGDRVSIIKLVSSDPDLFDMYDIISHCNNIIEVRLQEDIINTDIMINDLENIKLGHVVKITPTHLKNLATIFERVYNNRIKKYICVNCPSYAVNVINIIKQMIKPKLAERIHIYPGTEDLTKIVPASNLPKDYGGTEMSLLELHDLWKKKMEEYRDRFDTLDTLRPDENLRPTPLVNDDVLGFHGNFRKLSVD